MQLTIELSGAIAQQIRPHIEHIDGLTRKTQQNALVLTVFETINVALPVFYEPGDSVHVKGTGTELIVDSIASSDADQIVVHTVDREIWEVRHIDEIERYIDKPWPIDQLGSDDGDDQ